MVVEVEEVAVDSEAAVDSVLEVIGVEEVVLAVAEEVDVVVPGVVEVAVEVPVSELRLRFSSNHIDTKVYSSLVVRMRHL